MCGGRSSVGRASAALVWVLAGPLTARAVPVTWEAQGVVEYSDLDAEFFATFMPGLTGTQAGDELRLRISFDTEAAFIRHTTFPAGGQSFSYDGSSLVMALEVLGRGTHVFTIDDTVPPGAVSSFVAVIDDWVRGIGEPAVDGLLFSHAYLTPEGDIDFTVLAHFFGTDTTLIDGPGLPTAPDPRLPAGVEREISIVDPVGVSGSLLGIFSSLVRLPEPGTLGSLSVGLLALGALQRRRTAT
jgi:hypothetical protein